MKDCLPLKNPFRAFLTLAVFVCAFIGMSSAQAFAQDLQKKIDLTCQNEPMPSVLKKVEKASGFKVLFTYNEVQKFKVTVNLRQRTVGEVVAAIVSPFPLQYKVEGKYISISNKQAGKGNMSVITGKVKDSMGDPLPGVSIYTNDPSVAGMTDADGNFSIAIPAGKNVKTVNFSFIGMQKVSVPFTGKPLRVAMKEDAHAIDEVVVNGIYERKKESFTGSATVVSKDELMRNGSQNLLQNLKNIDPSFKIVENMDLGSDPNTMPNIQMRGQQSMVDVNGSYQGNPNQPLFILDGFETDMTTVYDLDMNRVETVVLLKDAAAKAIYGSKAANGVVVIETRKPEAGKLRVTYKGDLNLTIPDLTGYNLCNSSEKYEVEKDFRVFGDSWFREQYLNNIMKAIAQGVDTDWLAQPLRTGVGHRHSVYLEGGDQRLRYGVDLLYNDIKGVMKGSDRKTFTGGFTLSYRYKNLLFRNQFSASLNHADNSPYGNFSEYVVLNPYWTPYDGNGELKQVAGTTGGGGMIGATMGNPLWNAQIGTKDFSKYTGLTNNFYIEWQALKQLKLIGRFSLSKTISSKDVFYPASHTKYLSYSEDKFFEKGEYTKTNAESSSYSADITANYSLLVNKHQMYFNAGYSLKQERSESTTFQVVGFPNERTGFITSGLGFTENYRPTGNESIGRELGLLTALNYSYDDRYLLDATYRANASSRFGKDKRWGSFWSAGLGWNLHKEHFMEDVTWLKQFKLRASTGYTGSQNFNPYQALATFSYFQNQAYDNWVGSYLKALPNDDLKWQKTKDYNIGFDLNLFNRLTVRYDYYVQQTTDQLLSLTIPPSMGFTSYKENLGSTENKGMELRTSINLLLDPKRDRYITANFSIAKNTNKLKQISNALKAQNDSQDKEITSGNTNKPRTRYVEGQSMNAIWAVRSLGIDPATGNELFLTKDGQTTTEWRTEDQVVCGDAMPKCTGNFGVNMDYRGIFCNVSFYYQFGGQTYNQTLVDRVENANVSNNVDKRIYNSVWHNPGDQVSFAYSPAKNTKPSSRFVQDLNELRLSTLNVGYDFRHHAFVKRIGLERLKASFYMDDVFRLSSVKVERGLTYPFARTYSVSLQATF